ncbi:MAG: hypothetical protein MSA54_03870 [Campylobacter sp.]|uniref:hypothetical protein n=1 Tax=Campylobacter sp. TaxID=205 RepID=UPI002A4D64C7|nr:hypothetical protein [Campylobacter sp.]MCI7501068.1 hypothetical protein [Campylobacter sp.]MDD6924949.1 hypothetical protein [Campylobacteraceae bacterium]MDY5115265.1 hypothetical protein [Campylobacter sp.]
MLKDFCFLNNDEILAVFHSRSQPEIYSFLGDFSGRKNELKAFKKIRILKIWRYFDKKFTK